ncbi:hypothetical protein G6F56_005530 [Rhizopus delemar]|nr:hypothetical protein G6F56_005530 [Rhizopus delemar]
MEPKEITQTLGHQPKRNAKLSTSYKSTIDPQERLLFLKEMERAREDMAEFKKNMTMLVEQMNTISTDLVVYENNQLQGRLTLLEKHQKTQQGNVHHAAKRIDEYTQMLEQAQGTIHLLQEPKSPLSSRRTSTTSTTSSSWTDDEKLSQTTL